VRRTWQGRQPSRDALYDDRGAEQENHAGKMKTSRAMDKTDEPFVVLASD
jgi:hypothetical protein